MSMKRLVGTDIVQSIPLVGSAAIGHALFGGFEFGLTAAIVIGSIPGVLAGSWLSSRASNILLRPILAFVLLASGLKLLGLSATALAITMGIVALVGLPVWAFIDGYVRPPAAWRAAGCDRRRTLGLISLGTPVGVGFVTSAVYFGRQRPRLVLASSPDARLVPERAAESAAARSRLTPTARCGGRAARSAATAMTTVTAMTIATAMTTPLPGQGAGGRQRGTSLRVPPHWERFHHWGGMSADRGGMDTFRAAGPGRDPVHASGRRLPCQTVSVTLHLGIRPGARSMGQPGRPVDGWVSASKT
jgi:Sulfite exporter TauE/SafE